MKRLNVNLSEEEHRDLKIALAKEGKSIAEWVRECIKRLLEER